MSQLYLNKPCSESVPGSINVCIQVFLRRFAGADAVTGVVVREDVTVDASSQPDVEAAHLAQVNSVPMGEKHCESEREYKTNDTREMKNRLIIFQ